MKRLIIIGISLITGWEASSQMVYSNSIFVIQGATVTAQSIENHATMINNGNLLVSGAWNNTGTYDPSATGSVTLTGTLLQTIHNNNQQFFRLILQGGGIKNYSGNIFISNKLDFQEGILLSEHADDAIILSSDATISGGSNSSHVNGAVTRQGTGNLVFPVGDGSVYLPVEISTVPDPDAMVTVRAFNLSSGVILEPSQDLNSISHTRYWQISQIAGNLDNCSLSLPIQSEMELADDLSRLVIAYAASLPGPFLSYGQLTSEGTIFDGKITGLHLPVTGFYALASVSEGSAVEVFNAISVNMDGLNEAMRIGRIEDYPNNTVSIFNRWGDKVYEMRGYDNDQKIFRGEGNLNSATKLPPAIYFYIIDLGIGQKKITGYLSLKR